jgi:uncharacterized protein (DUF2336 family)
MAGAPDAKDNKVDVRQLMDLAHDKSAESRRVLLENISDLFLSPEGRLSERERSLMAGILSHLIHDVEMSVRRDLAKRLADEEGAPHELIVVLANDEFEIAHPILAGSGVLSDSDLIEIVRHRTQEHRLDVATRGPLSEAVAEALVDTGDRDVIEALLNNHDAEISSRTMDYLVSESQRVDSFQHPLLRRPDLPVTLAHRMFWWVSAALREHILENYKVDEATLDTLIHDTTTRVKDVAEADRSTYADAEFVVSEIAAKGQLDDRFLIQCLRRGRLAAFMVALANLANVDVTLVRHVMFDPGGEGLAVLSKAARIDRAVFSSIFLLTREAREGVHVTDPKLLSKMLKIYDGLSETDAAGALQCWQLDADYLDTIDQIKSAKTRSRRGLGPGRAPSSTQ